MKNMMATVATQQDILDLKQDLKQVILDLRDEMRSEFRAVRREMTDGFASLRREITDDVIEQLGIFMDLVDDRFNDLEANVDELRQEIKTGT